MMDDLTAKEGHLPWVGQNGWSTTSAQGPLLNPMSSSQHLSLGSSSIQRSSYNHLQVPNQSCMRDLSSLLSSNSPHQSALYKASQAGSSPSPGMLFADTVMPNVPQVIPFAQEIPHTSSMLLSANQGKSIPSLSLIQRNQAQQHLSLPPPQDPYKVSFQPQITSHGLPNGLQTLPISLPSCGLSEQCQWIPSSLCRGAVNESLPGAAAHPNKEQSQEGNINPLASNERQRLVLLNQRAQLLQQLAELDKALESMPPEDSSDGQPPHTANQPTPSMEDSQCEEMKTSDAQQDQVPTAKSENKEPDSAESGDDGNLDDPVSDDDFSEFIPDPAGFSSDDSYHSRPSTPVDEKPVLSGQESNESGSPPSKAKDVGTPIMSSGISWKKSSKIAVTPTPNSKGKPCRLRKNYCLFCSKPVTKMSRHFEAIHSDKPEVAVVFQYPKKSKERLKIWKRLINQGNFLHNKDVLKTGKGQLTARKRPSMTRQAQDFLHCLYCRGLFLRRCLRKHIRSCPEKVKNENQLEVGRRRIAALCAMEASEDLCITDGLKNILSVMTYDEVTRAIMDDPVVLQLGELLFSQHGSDEKRHEYIRQNLRQLARLVLEAQKTSRLKKLEDFFKPSNFPDVVSTVKVLAGFDPETKTYKAPSLAVKLGYIIQKACAIVEGNAAKRGDARAAESAREFQLVYQERWTQLISSAALKTLRKTKVLRDKKVPFARDVKRLNFHLEKVHDLTETKLRDCPSVENYSALTRVILARTMFFNRRCAREVSYVELEGFMSRKKSSLQTGMDVSVSDLERAMCAYFTRIDIRGKCGRTVPIFLKPSFVSALELMVEVRKACGVPTKNPYLFGRPHGLSPYHGSDCIQKYVKDCGAEDPDALKSKNIRKHYAEMLQMMNLDENEANLILGPNNQVQTLRRDTDMHDAAAMQSDERLPQAASWDQNECSSAPNGPSTFNHPPAHEEMRGDNMTTPQPSVNPDKKGSKSKSIHRTWEEAEVQAVERHMMRFIQRQKVPQKDDCVECLEAEPEALSTRSWKGVKDYVRNRITALKRISGTSKAS
ncbi:uncharacterized protein LOC117818719 isoform X2 [Notolabrus celidotus]|uniref:uncharacterized protein LOC117818719 isoform X2 n=1 Tax=Notolabrus celidotus TaxID=1203425 RepID=UPI00148F5D93|nr:uncharacterized protein LOC117818719 isoform X2 [Notolabrus celidotus]XP_034547619.1 uncharacterized protein LOC117818719 isoform X2 [Notolabrus celidotus]XP_034547620.1 uncharacterized protein LOC117818719 isoform X2 [Notolabrus celidotus]